MTETTPAPPTAPEDRKPRKAPTPPEPAPAPGVVITRKPNGIVITNYTGEAK